MEHVRHAVQKYRVFLIPTSLIRIRLTPNSLHVTFEVVNNQKPEL